MTHLYKRMALVVVLTLELAVVTVLVREIPQLKGRVLGDKHVASIDKSAVTMSEEKLLEYYWEFDADKTLVDERDWLDYDATYTINQDGLNETREYEVLKPKNAYRILALGDSFTFGHFVSTPENWTEQLENKINLNLGSCDYDSVEVINLGAPGFDVKYIVERYRDKGVKYQADLVIWLESGSGFGRLNEFMQPKILECLESKGYEEKMGDDDVNNDIYSCWIEAESEVWSENSRTDLFGYLDLAFNDFFVEAGNQQKLFVYFNPLSQEKKQRVDSLRQRHPGASYEALVPTLAGDFVLPDGHPSSKGHSLISDSVYKYLLQHQLRCADE